METYFRFKENEKVIKRINEFDVGRSTISFQILLAELVDKYPKAKNLSLFLHFLKNHIKLNKDICREISSDFK